MAGQTVPRHTTVAFVEFLNDIVTSQPELARFIETPRTSMVALYFGGDLVALGTSQPLAWHPFRLPGATACTSNSSTRTRDLPAGVRIIDPSRSRTSGESQRVRHAQRQRRHPAALRHHDEEQVCVDVAGQHHVLHDVVIAAASVRASRRPAADSGRCSASSTRSSSSPSRRSGRRRRARRTCRLLP